MPVVKIPFATSSRTSGRISAGRLVNAIVEDVGDQRTVITRAPGLRRAFSPPAGSSHCRGLISINNTTLYSIYDNEVVEYNSPAGVLRGTMPGTSLVTLAKNNATIPDVVCVVPEIGAFKLISGGAPLTYPDTDVGTPVTVCQLGPFLVFTYSSGLVRSTGINVLDINTLDSIVIDEGLIAGVVFRNQLYFFGPKTTQVWEQNPANIVGFFASRVTFIERGLLNRNAVAGFEEGFAQVLIWIGQDNIVYMLNGYNPERISNSDIEKDIQNLADKSSINAFCFSNSGHQYCAIRSSIFCHVYDMLTGSWHERRTYESKTWQGIKSVYHNNNWLIGSSSTGSLFNIDSNIYLEDSSPLVFMVMSGISEAFPNRFLVNKVEFDIQTGKTDVINEDSLLEPRISIEWSDDGGETFLLPVNRSLGKKSDFIRNITVLRCGRASRYGRRWRLTVSDNLNVKLLGGAMNIEVEEKYE